MLKNKQPNYSDREREVLSADYDRQLIDLEWITNEVEPRTIKILGPAMIDPDLHVVEIEDGKYTMMTAGNARYDGHVIGTDIWIAPGFETLLPKLQHEVCATKDVSGTAETAVESNDAITTMIEPYYDEIDPDLVIKQLKDKYKHILIVFGGTGSAYCYLDLSFSEAVDRLKDNIERDCCLMNLEGYKTGCRILGFDDYFPAYDIG